MTDASLKPDGNKENVCARMNKISDKLLFIIFDD